MILLVDMFLFLGPYPYYAVMSALSHASSAFITVISVNDEGMARRVAGYAEYSQYAEMRSPLNAPEKFADSLNAFKMIHEDMTSSRPRRIVLFVMG